MEVIEAKEICLDRSKQKEKSVAIRVLNEKIYLCLSLLSLSLLDDSAPLSIAVSWRMDRILWAVTEKNVTLHNTSTRTGEKK